MDVKANAQHVVTAAAAALVELSHAVHSHPELAFEEERAAAWVADALSGPFSIEAGVCDLPTAFVATAGTGPLTVAICAEYDALPEHRPRLRSQRDRGRCSRRRARPRPAG